MTIVEGKTGVIVIDPLLSPKPRTPRSNSTAPTAAIAR
jgi:alkyl sulfatase BDS1-like metallo-beta-lactamase superfamily hydrolase